MGCNCRTRNFFGTMRNSHLVKLGWISLLFSCQQNKLDGKVQKIQLEYIAWACDCANWALPNDIEKYHDHGDTLSELCVFIEPADSSLILPNGVGASMNVIEFTGQFYKIKGFPKGYKSAEMPDKARVFRYTKYRLIRRPKP